MVKPGPIIGLILGVLMAGSAVMGFLTGEASFADSKGKMIGIGFLVFGTFMVIVNIIVLATGKEKLIDFSGGTTSAAPGPVTTVKQPSVESVEVEGKPKDNLIRCRFCKKLYDADYNGCPYCKKK